VKMNAEHALGLYDAELETARQALEVCGNKVYLQIKRARARIGRGEIDLVENILNDGLKASDARRYSLNLFLEIARELEAHGHPALSLDVAERGVDHARDHLNMNEATEWQRLRYVQLLVMLGRLDEADKLLLALNGEIPDDEDILGWLGIVAAQRGDTQAAMRTSAMLRDLDRPYARGWIGFYRAGIAAHLDHPDEALSLLRDAFSRGFPWSTDLHVSLELKPLRGHPDFEAILHPEE
ncbi:MAG: hypothetical protein DRQ45_07960, partial [Gammaproteobacteria bacterium]